MSRQDDFPPRWLDEGSDCAEAIRDVLRLTAQDDPSSEEFEKFGARVAPLFEPSPPGGGTGGGETGAAGSGGAGAGGSIAPAAAAASGGTTKFIAAVATGVALLGGAGLVVTQSGSGSAVREPRALVQRVKQPAPVAAPQSSAAAPAPSASKAPSGPPSARAPRFADAASRPSESELLRRAHDALRSGNGAAALKHVAEHRRSYPRGLLSQEREVVTIEALAQSGNRAAALSQGKAFLSRYPRSTHARRVRAVLGIPDDDANAGGGTK